MPGTVNLIDRTTGRTFGVPAEQVATYKAQGFREETDQESIDRTAAETFHAEHGGIGGAVGSAVAGGLSGLTLGLSDQALSALGADRMLRHMEAEHPYAAGGGTIAGALLPTIFTGGAAAGEEAAGIGARILASSPAGLAGRAGRAISEVGEGAGLAGRALAGTAGAAAEGALYGGGQYLTETALEDKPLSAEGFVAGMGHGALFAAPIGGAGMLASATLQRARSLFPRSEITAAAAAGVKKQASSALAQSVRDGDAMVQAAERKLSDIDAGTQMAQAGETTTRRVFGGADPQALADQVTGATARQQVGQALEGYQQARQQFNDWLAHEADPELERALTGLAPGDLQTPAGPRVPLGEFGVPGARGIKTPAELQRAIEDSAPAAIEQPATAVLRGGARATPAPEIVQRGLSEQPATAAGGRPAAPSGGPLEIRRVKDGRNVTYEAKLPDGTTRTLADRGEVSDLVDSQLPSGFRHGPLLETHRDLAVARGLPKDAASIRDNALYVAKPSELADHGIMGNDLHPEHEARMAEARATDVKLEPIEVKVTPDGRYWLEEGNHRLNEAAKSDAPVAIKFKAVSEKFERQRGTYDISDRIRSTLPSQVAAPGDDLLAALAGTKGALDRGESFTSVGRAPAMEARAAQRGRAAGAAQHFRVQALEARAAAEPEVGDATMGRILAKHGLGEPAPAAAAPREPDTLAARILHNESRPAMVAATSLVSDAAVAGGGKLAPMTRAELAEQRARFRAIAPEQRAAKAIMRHNGKDVDIGPAIAREAQVIGNMEGASARLADALGSEAPPAAAANAKAFHGATGQAQERAAASSAKTAADLKTKAPAATSEVAAAHAGSTGGRLADVGSALEVMRAIGMHVPAVSHIPVIGPILGLWLKARAVVGILGRKGGSIGRSTEGLIASKAAAVQDRIVAATGALLEDGARAAGKASHLAGPAVLLAGALFPGGGKSKGDDPRGLFEARSSDITRAMQPGAIDQAIAQRYPTSDPAMHDAIVAQVQRGIAFLDSKRPKQTVLPGVLPGDGTWKPSTAAIEEFGKFVHAVNDPVSVLEDLAKGHPSAEGAETLRVVYPELYRYAQKELLAAAPEMAKTLPYSRRVMISILYQIPVDGTMQPSHAQYLQIPAAPTPAPKAPATTGPLRLGQQTMSPLDQRAAGA